MSGSGNGNIEGFTFNTSSEATFCTIDPFPYNRDVEYTITAYKSGSDTGHWKLVVKFERNGTPEIVMSFGIIGCEDEGILRLRVKKDTWDPPEGCTQTTRGEYSFQELFEIAKGKCENFGIYSEKCNSCQNWVNLLLGALNLNTYWTGFGKFTGFSILAASICNIV